MRRAAGDRLPDDRSHGTGLTANNSTSFADGKPGLNKYDGKSGALVMTVEFVPGSCDMHDVTVWNGELYGVDAGEHPGWPIEEKYARPGFPELNSPSGGYIFKIDLI